MVAAAQPGSAAPATAAEHIVLTTRARDLISYVRGHKSIFDPGEGFASTQITLTRKNDTGRSCIPADEIETNAHVLPGADVAHFVQANSERLLNDAVAAAYRVQPALEHDPSLADIVTNDLGIIIRVVSYAIAVASPNFIHPNNIGIMAALHDEVGFSTDARNAALTTLSDAIAPQAADPAVAQNARACFQQITELMAA